MICKKGELRAGLSLYYVRLRDTGDTLYCMLQHLGGLGESNRLVGSQNLLGSIVLKDNTKCLRERWENIIQLLAHEY